MSDLAALISDHLDIWTAATERKNGAGRGGGKRVSLYGIERLRALILDLAVRGRLVRQDGDDGTGAALLEAIEAERRRQFSSGEAKRLTNPDPLNDAPFPIPESWAWTQIGVLTNYSETEKADPGSVDDDTWVLELEDLEKGTSRLIERVTHSTRKFQSQKNWFRVGDVLYGKLRPYLDKVLIADMPGICTTEMVPMRAYYGVEATYLRLFLKSPFFISFADSSTHGMNLPRLGTDKARAAPFALPPLAEQRRIVAKVDELMALCDALEGESAAALTAHQTLVETLLAILVNSADAADLAANWTRLEVQFDTLFTTEASVDALKQTILDLAVRGWLVEQQFEPSDTLSAIAAERQAMATAKQIRFKTSRTTLAAMTPPFESPRFWQWSALGELGGLENGDRGREYPNKSALKDSGVPFVNAGHLENGVVNLSLMTFISEEHFSRLGGGKFKEGDILYCLRGSLGKAGLVVGIGRGAIASSLVIIRLAPSFLRSFMMIYLGSRLARAMVKRYDNGTAQPNLSSENLAKFLVPVPPLAEQRRIVAKVAALMSLCEDLQARITDTGQIQMHLADAIVEGAVA